MPGCNLASMSSVVSKTGLWPGQSGPAAAIVRWGRCLFRCVPGKDTLVRIDSIHVKRLLLGAAAALIALTVFGMSATPIEAQRGQGALGTIYVTSQGLYYDTFVTAEKLPPHGRFQLLVGGQTEFGPGEPGYLGGRWMVPNGSGGFDYLLCPLLGPGRTTP